MNYDRFLKKFNKSEITYSEPIKKNDKELLEFSKYALQGILSNKSIEHSDKYLAERAISVSKEILKQLRNDYEV